MTDVHLMVGWTSGMRWRLEMDETYSADMNPEAEQRGKNVLRNVRNSPFISLFMRCVRLSLSSVKAVCNDRWCQHFQPQNPSSAPVVQSFGPTPFILQTLGTPSLLGIKVLWLSFHPLPSCKDRWWQLTDLQKKRGTISLKNQKVWNLNWIQLPGCVPAIRWDNFS